MNITNEIEVYISSLSEDNKVKTIETTNTTIELNELNSGTKYLTRVRSKVNNMINEWSNIVPFTTNVGVSINEPLIDGGMVKITTNLDYNTNDISINECGLLFNNNSETIKREIKEKELKEGINIQLAEGEEYEVNSYIVDNLNRLTFSPTVTFSTTLKKPTIIVNYINTSTETIEVNCSVNSTTPVTTKKIQVYSVDNPTIIYEKSFNNNQLVVFKNNDIDDNGITIELLGGSSYYVGVVATNQGGMVEDVTMVTIQEEIIVDYLTIEPLENGISLTITPNDGWYGQYSTNLIDWIDITNEPIGFNTPIYIKGIDTLDIDSTYNEGCCTFSNRGRYRISGDITDLIGRKDLRYSQFKNIFASNDFEQNLDFSSVNTLNDYCYKQMFANSTISSTPLLPNIKLFPHCYDSMFLGCNLITTFELLNSGEGETALNCFQQMFEDCASLSRIEIKSKTWDESNSTDWVNGVNLKGVFIKPNNLSMNFNTNAIPLDWNVINR